MALVNNALSIFALSTTIGTTPGVIVLYTNPANTVISAGISVVARDIAGSGDMIRRSLAWTSQRVGSGSPAIIGSVDSTNPKRVGSGITWNTTVAANGNDIELTIQGSTGLTIDWLIMGMASTAF